MLTEEERHLVEGVYYNLKNGGAFLSPNKVHQILKSQGFTSPGLYKIRRYIQSLDDYSLQKPVRRYFKRARVEVAGPYEQFQADLADVSNISKQNGGIRFLLVVIDVFSRFLWVEHCDICYGSIVDGEKGSVLRMVKSYKQANWTQSFTISQYVPRCSPHLTSRW